MAISKKLIVRYLAGSSVILHILLALFAYQYVKVMQSIDTARVHSVDGTNRATVKDVCVFQEGDYTYNGYLIDYKGKTLYISGSASQHTKIGDEVCVYIYKNPNSPVKDLTITVIK